MLEEYVPPSAPKQRLRGKPHVTHYRIEYAVSGVRYPNITGLDFDDADRKGYRVIDHYREALTLFRICPY